MAEVYLAEQRSLRRQVALKVLKSNLAKDESYVKRFHNEAQAAAALVHANIVQIHEVGQMGGTHYIVQEYVQGQNLGQYLSRHGAADGRLAMAVMRQVAAALHRAGEQGIIHRDIKPENIMLSSGGEVKVADFGLARISGGGEALNLTRVGTTMGTPLYMSPEQAEGKTLDPRSDIYSFGVSCYHMLAGQPPFDGDTALSVAVQHVKKQPELLNSLRPDLPAGLCRIVHKMLAKGPGQRYQRAADLLQDLRTVPVEGLDEDWSSGLEDWSAAELTALPSAPAKATPRLDALMKTSSLAAVRRGRSRLFVAGVVVVMLLAFLLGAAVAWATRQPSLLKLPPREPASLIEHQETV